MDKKRRGFTKEYIEFEIRYLGQLEELWYETPNDELRQVILDAREALQSIFMSRCTCASDKEITCIVHPTTHSLKEYIAYLEEHLELCVTTEYHDSIVAEAMQRLADSDRAVVVLSKRIEYLEEQVELEYRNER